MNITLNGEPRELSTTTLGEVLIELGYEEANVATALNGIFVAAQARERTVLSDGDALEVLAPMQGG